MLQTVVSNRLWVHISMIDPVASATLEPHQIVEPLVAVAWLSQNFKLPLFSER